MRVPYILILTFFSVSLIVFSCKTKKDIVQEKRPNILFILCDDLGYSDVGFNGSTDIKTPVLDRLANSGAILKAAYVAHPFCGPSRAAIMTGRYPHTIGSQFNLTDASDDIKEGIPVDETYISKVLQKSGYYTGAIGKWHLGYDTQFQPNNRGFDDFYGFLGGGHKYFPEQYKPIYERELKAGTYPIFVYLTPLLHNTTEIAETEYLTDAFSREAVRFVKEAAQKEQPFFLYLAYNAPHVPLEAKQEDLEKFMQIEDEDRRTFAAMVYAVDRGVGEIEGALKATGQYDNTLIVFLSDNGGNIHHGATNFPLTGSKGDTYEGGYRVPMFFHWPDVVPAGNFYNYPVSAIDFYPTFARLAGATIPDEKQLDGNDIWDDFLADKSAHDGEMMYVLRHRTGYSDVGARRDQWKALKINQEPWKLINIKDDIRELHDVSAENPDLLNEMVSEAEKWSRTHVQPLWFHDEQTGIEWKSDNMPRFDETFKIE